MRTPLRNMDGATPYSSLLQGCTVLAPEQAFDTGIETAALLELELMTVDPDGADLLVAWVRRARGGLN